MRLLRLLAGLIACLAVAVALGCGGDDDESGGVGSALDYVPANTPFAIVVDTDLQGDQYKALDKILKRFPGSEQILALIEAQLTLGQEGVNFDKDLKPLLGNPAVISATDVTSFLSDSDESGFVAALQVSDTEALDNLIEKTKAQERGEVAGATVYQDEDTLFAVADDTVVLAGSRELLDAALQRADGGDSLSEDDFNSALEGLPEGGVARVYVDVQALLGQSEGAKAARRIEWVDALRTLGLTVSATEKSIDVNFNLRTEGDLSDEDLPLASGEEAAKVVQIPGGIGVGLRDPRQLVTFFETAFQAVDPNSFGDYAQGKQALSAQLDIDVDEDIFAQLTGNLSVSVSLDGNFGVRADVKDPQAFSATVDKVAEALPDFGSGLGIEGVRRSGDLYEAQLDGGGSFLFGMVGDAFVAGTDRVRTEAMARAKPTSVEGASGSVVVGADAEALARQLFADILPQFGVPDPLVPVFAEPFDELTGSVVTSTDGMQGEVSLTLDD
jgi:Protein of unknown function (DUF3352)